MHRINRSVRWSLLCLVLGADVANRACATAATTTGRWRGWPFRRPEYRGRFRPLAGKRRRRGRRDIDGRVDGRRRKRFGRHRRRAVAKLSADSRVAQAAIDPGSGFVVAHFHDGETQTFQAIGRTIWPRATLTLWTIFRMKMSPSQ